MTPWLGFCRYRCRRLHLSALRDDALQLWFVVGAARDVLDLAHHEEAVLDHAPKDHVLVVEPLRLGTRKEELRLERGGGVSQQGVLRTDIR